MPAYNINDLTGWKHLPIDAIVFFYDKLTDADNKVTVRNIIEGGANWTLSEIKSKHKDADGNPRIVALGLQGSITLLENDIYTLRTMVDYMKASNPVDMYIKLKGDRANAGDISFRFNDSDLWRHFSTTLTQFSDDGINTKLKIDFIGRANPDAFVFNPAYTI